MASIRCFLCLALMVGAGALDVTPIAQVIKLLTDLKNEVVTDAKAEASVYSEFADDCKTKTKAKSSKVLKGSSRIGVESSQIESKTAKRNMDGFSLGKRKAKQEKLSKNLESANARCAKEKAEYEAANADVSKAISSLDNAGQKVSDSDKASLLQASTRKDLMETIELAEAMSMVTAPKHRAIASMIQSVADPKPDAREYAFHSDDIIELLGTLLKQFKAKKKSQDDDFAKGQKACAELKKSLKKAMAANTAAMTALSKNIQKLDNEIGELRGDLIDDDAEMKDNELYLKDLTAECEARANDWDQRTRMRNDEISAMDQALDILKNGVKGRADKVNQRALLQKVVKPKSKAAPVADTKPVSSHSPKDPKTSKVQTPKVQATKAIEKPVSFFQALQRKQQATSFLAAGLSTEGKKDKALALLSSEGHRLGSLVLMSLAQGSAADPFEKVKGLVQKLIERLVQEATSEATKKGFCDTEVGKAEQERDFRRTDTQDLSAVLERLEAKRDSLTNTLKTLNGERKELNAELKEGTKVRKEDKEANAETLNIAQNGKESLNNALNVLKSFYESAAKASFVQVQAQSSPIIDDGVDAGFDGSYSGKQTGSKAILDLLETIGSDFDRTIRTTEAEEADAAATWVKEDRSLKASIAANEEKDELCTQDLRTTKDGIATNMVDLDSNQKMLDEALKELEELKPVCIDSGMSYKERVAKREAEMKALQKAVCILGGAVSDGC